jgi:hypothetical protein
VGGVLGLEFILGLLVGLPLGLRHVAIACDIYSNVWQPLLAGWLGSHLQQPPSLLIAFGQKSLSYDGWPRLLDNTSSSSHPIVS